MTNRPPASLKKIATDLSNKIISGNHSQEELMLLLEQLPQTSCGEEMNKYPQQVAPGSGESVGIWKKTVKNGAVSYIRDPIRMREWTMWANVREILPKGKKKRVLLLGESVARGIFYDPAYTVAKELRFILNNFMGEENVEVIDLARIGILMDELLEVVETCVCLEPDAVIIFAGNNWVYKAQGVSTYEELFCKNKLSSFAETKTFLEDILQNEVAAFFDKVRKRIMDRNIQVIFLVPEFNLKDWKCCEMETLPVNYSSNTLRDWYGRKADAEIALQNNDIEQLKILGKKLIELDPSNPFGFEVMGEYYLQTGDLVRATEYLEHAKDAILFCRCVNTMARCVNVVRSAIITNGNLHGIRVINLPEVFRNEFPGTLPDRRLFLDNCHLSREGINMAMVYAAEAVLEIFTQKVVNLKELKTVSFEPGSKIESYAHFAAAVYNAHYGQGYEIILYHCNKAVSLFPAIKDIMLFYLDFTTRRTNTILCKSFEKLVMYGGLEQFLEGFSFRHPLSIKLMDVRLTDAMATSLQSIHPSIKKKIAELRIREHGVSRSGVDLLESFYSRNSYVELYFEGKSNFVRQRFAKSSFHFVSDGEQPVSFKLEYRVAKEAAHGSCLNIYINNMETIFIECMPLPDWTVREFVVEKQYLRKGVNEIILEWPLNRSLAGNDTGHSIDDLINTVYPVLGDIYFFSAHEFSSQPLINTHTDSSLSELEFV